MKKIVIFGGGSGLSQLLKGLIQFPVDITAVVSVSDDGASTGRLRNEFDIPAVGDITKVLMSMSTESKDVKDLFWSIMFNLKRLKSISILLAFVVFFSIIKCPNSCIIDASNAEITKKLLFIKNKSVIKNIKEKSICIL